jgi:Golgi phosphoprotein 3 (GPP34)
VAQFNGTGRLADDLNLMAHHEVTGKSFLQPRATGLGLAGALLAELVMLSKVAVWPDGVAVADRNPPADDLAGLVLRHLLSEHEMHPAQDWLLFLGRTAAGQVTRRLEQSGYLAPTAARRPWRPDRWVPVNADCAFAPLVRVLHALKSSRPVVEGVVLAGLADACGLGPRLEAYGPPNIRNYLGEAVGQLGPDLR